MYHVYSMTRIHITWSPNMSPTEITPYQWTVFRHGYSRYTGSYSRTSKDRAKRWVLSSSWTTKALENRRTAHNSLWFWCSIWGRGGGEGPGDHPITRERHIGRLSGPHHRVLRTQLPLWHYPHVPWRPSGPAVDKVPRYRLKTEDAPSIGQQSMITSHPWLVDLPWGSEFSFLK